jgi:hypothetical protein
MPRTKKITVVRKQTKIPWRVSQRTISLACDQFFIARGMLNREPFNQWRKSTAKRENEDEEEDQLA